jgi:hypothetical protein
MRLPEGADGFVSLGAGGAKGAWKPKINFAGAADGKASEMGPKDSDLRAVDRDGIADIIGLNGLV